MSTPKVLAELVVYIALTIFICVMLYRTTSHRGILLETLGLINAVMWLVLGEYEFSKLLRDEPSATKRVFSSMRSGGGGGADSVDGRLLDAKMDECGAAGYCTGACNGGECGANSVSYTDYVPGGNTTHTAVAVPRRCGAGEAPPKEYAFQSDVPYEEMQRLFDHGFDSQVYKRKKYDLSVREFSDGMDAGRIRDIQRRTHRLMYTDTIHPSPTLAASVKDQLWRYGADPEEWWNRFGPQPQTAGLGGAEYI